MAARPSHPSMGLCPLGALAMAGAVGSIASATRKGDGKNHPKHAWISAKTANISLYSARQREAGEPLVFRGGVS